MGKPKIRIDISGGVIQFITASMDIDIEIFDYDNQENEQGYHTICSPDEINSDLTFVEKQE